MNRQYITKEQLQALGFMHKVGITTTRKGKKVEDKIVDDAVVDGTKPRLGLFVVAQEGGSMTFERPGLIEALMVKLRLKRNGQ